MSITRHVHTGLINILYNIKINDTKHKYIKNNRFIQIHCIYLKTFWIIATNYIMPKTDNNNKWDSYHWNPNLPLWRTYPYNVIKLEKYGLFSVFIILHKITWLEVNFYIIVFWKRTWTWKICFFCDCNIT